MKTMLAPVMLVLALGATSSACLVRQVDHVVHVYPDDSARWTIRQDGIHSDAKERPAARDEERAWLEAMRRGETPEQRLLVELDPVEAPASLVLDEEAPMAAWSEARYGSIYDVALRVARLLDPGAEVTLTRTGCERTLAITLDIDGDDGGGDGDSGDLESRLGGSPAIDSLSLVLQSGRFVAASGFSIAGDSTATLLTEAEDHPDGERATWSLTWVACEEAGRPAVQPATARP